MKKIIFICVLFNLFSVLSSNLYAQTIVGEYIYEKKGQVEILTHRNLITEINWDTQIVTVSYGTRVQKYKIEESHCYTTTKKMILVYRINEDLRASITIEYSKTKPVSINQSFIGGVITKIEEK